MKAYHHIFRDILLTILILSAAFAVSVLLQDTLLIPEQVTTTFAFAVFLVSMFTRGYLYGIAAAFISTVAINYAFTFPYFRLNFTIPTNLYSAIVMIVIAVLTSMLTTQVKQHEAIKAESEKERMRANLLRAVSHDLRTPLTTILGSSTALLDNRETLTEKQQENMLLGIREDAQWLVRMVENLLSVTRIDSSRVKIAKTPFAVDELLDSVVIKFKKRYPNQPILLDIPQEVMLVPMDPMLIEQVLINILENAVQHAEGMTELKLRVFPAMGNAVFEISDNGCGIRDDRLGRIFTGRDMADVYIADGRKHNAGIGLSVCATIIRAHDGEIAAQNRPEGGALFRFTLAMEEIDIE